MAERNYKQVTKKDGHYTINDRVNGKTLKAYLGGLGDNLVLALEGSSFALPIAAINAVIEDANPRNVGTATIHTPGAIPSGARVIKASVDGGPAEILRKDTDGDWCRVNDEGHTSGYVFSNRVGSQISNVTVLWDDEHDEALAEL